MSGGEQVGVALTAHCSQAASSRVQSHVSHTTIFSATCICEHPAPPHMADAYADSDWDSELGLEVDAPSASSRRLTIEDSRVQRQRASACAFPPPPPHPSLNLLSEL